MTSTQCTVHTVPVPSLGSGVSFLGMSYFSSQNTFSNCQKQNAGDNLVACISNLRQRMQVLILLLIENGWAPWGRTRS